jgi:hypothetical protein
MMKKEREPLTQAQIDRLPTLPTCLTTPYGKVEGYGAHWTGYPGNGNSPVHGSSFQEVMQNLMGYRL